MYSGLGQSVSIISQNELSLDHTDWLELLDVAPLHPHLPGVPTGEERGPARGAGGVDVVIVQYYPRPGDYIPENYSEFVKVLMKSSISNSTPNCKSRIFVHIYVEIKKEPYND